MSWLKTPMIRSRSYLDGSKGQSCVYCDRHDGTIVPAHYSGMWANRLGKGAGIKAHDLFVANCCHACHLRFDGYADGRDATMGLEQLIGICETQIQRVESGLLVVTGRS